MIVKSNNGYKLVCDCCGYEVDGFDCFLEAVDYKKENDWKSKKIGEEEWDSKTEDIRPCCPYCEYEFEMEELKS